MNNINKVIIGFSVLVSLAANAGETLFFNAAKISPNSPQSSTLKLSATDKGTTTSYHVLQFKSKITIADRLALKKLDIQVFRYIPDDAYLVKANQKQLDLAKAQLKLNGVIPFYASLKMSTDLPIRSVFNGDKFTRIIVSILDRTELQRIQKQLAKVGLVLEAGGKILDLKVALKDLEKVASVDGVEWLQPYIQMENMAYQPGSNWFQPNALRGDYTDLTGYETGTRIMNLEAAWKRGYSGMGQVVAMADTGLDTGDIKTMAADFQGALVSGHAFGMFSTTWADPNGHGTHVAGSVMGNGAISGGLLPGAAPGAFMVAEGMWSSTMKNLTVPPQLEKLFIPAYQDGARIHTNSWGSPSSLGRYDGMAAQVDEFMWENPDMLIIFAAGNSGVDGNRDGRIDEGSVSSPGTNKNGLTVGASENLLAQGGIQRKLGDLMNGEPWGVEPLKSDTLSNNPDGIAAFSSRGPTKDGRMKPDIVAPGTNIVSLCSQHKDASKLWGPYNNSYCYSGGTSMSTPLTAGAVAVLREVLNRDGVADPSAALMKAVMLNTATDMYPGQYGVGRGQELMKQGPNFHQGFGRVDMDLATSNNYTYMDDKTGVKDGFESKFEFKGSASKVTLAYTDAPGSPSAAKTLVNNLDLIVEANGKIYEAADKVNNVEHIVLPAGSGDITVRVRGTSIPKGKNGRQPFAVVVTM